MASLEPRPPYTEDELRKLYPSELKLKLVQVLFRHGERTPVSARFQEEGVPAFWPYCKSAAFFKAVVLNGNNGIVWDQLSYKRRVEGSAEDGSAKIAKGRRGEIDDLCLLGELTDRGRETTLQLGQRLRVLYMDQLKFLPEGLLKNSKEYYLRATPIPRTLISLQQVLTGMYPNAPHDPSADLTILSRSPPDENLFPNEANCRRFRLLARAFSTLATEKWNNSPDMQYLQSRIGKYLDGPVAIDGHPRLSGIVDSVNATLAHGEEVRMPNEFYEPKVREILNRINVDEWFRGYSESAEYRKLGIGSLLGDVKDRMVGVARGGSKLKLALYGTHDTTVVAMLASLGAFDGMWPPFTSNIAVELFKGPEMKEIETGASKEEGWGWMRWFGGKSKKDEDRALNGYYVRLRYNDNPVVVKGCRPKGRHLEGDESLCTLVAFKNIVEKMAPANLRRDCNSNLDQREIPPVEPVPE
ncbi:histidine phosphatase superfamily [Terfezia claveryi]|nr:histidine phosphatase superfamily [Terfezia claveryi]